MNIDKIIAEENEYVQSLLKGGQKKVNETALEIGKKSTLVMERFRNQRRIKPKLSSVITNEDALELFNFFGGDYYCIGMFLSVSHAKALTHFSSLVVTKEMFEEQYLGNNLNYEESALAIQPSGITTETWVTNKNRREWHIVKSKELLSKQVGNKLKEPETKKKANARRKETNLSRFGTATPLQNKDILHKQQFTVKERYGKDNISKVKVFRDKQKATSNERYGGEYYTDSPVHRLKFLSKVFSPTAYVTTPEQALTLIGETPEGKMLPKLNALVNRFLSDTGKDKATVYNVAEDILGVPYTYLNGKKKGTGYIQVDKNDNLTSNRRRLEEALGDYLKSFGYEVISNKMYKELGGKQLDFYIPELSLAFEFNGTYFHATDGTDRGVDRNYHLTKSMEARENMGVTLFHVWESDWEDEVRNDIVRSQIAYKMKSQEVTHLYARKTELKEISAKVASSFFESNHIQGGAGSSGSVRYGLFHEGVLVAAMSFGRRYTGNGGAWELIRFSNKKYTTVVGGASKLLKAFSSTHKGEKLMSYANNDFAFSSEGSMYTALGFDFIKTTTPGYHWVGINSKVNNIVINRQKVMPKNLVSFTEGRYSAPFEGATPDFRISNPRETEKEYMVRNNFVRVYNAGNDLYTKIM